MTTARSLVTALVLCIGSARAAPPEESPPPPPPTLAARCGYPFTDHAVLQQGIPLPVWGTSLPDAKVTVNFARQTRQTTADNEGRWRVILDPVTAAKLKAVNDAPAGMEMTVTCEKDGERATTRIKDLVPAGEPDKPAHGDPGRNPAICRIDGSLCRISAGPSRTPTAQDEGDHGDDEGLVAR